MRLLTHNSLSCHVKGCNKNNFPLKIAAKEVKKQETGFSAVFVKRMLQRVDWLGLVAACKDIDISLPAEIPKDAVDNEEFLKNVHTILMEVQIHEGSLTCPNCSRVYPISNGVANMLLNETEV